MAQEKYSVIIVGAGFSGICMGVQLKKEGIHDFIILEGEDGPGGTWRVNTYPGAACDVQSHLYSFSFEPYPEWSRMFGLQDEILSYQEHCFEKYGLYPHARFNVRVVAAVFDDKQACWLVKTSDGSSFLTDFLVSGTGGLSKPSLPQIAGLESFTGSRFHSAQWNHGISLKGKRVAVIGSGASAIQIVPAIADEVAQLYYYQRTPSWVLPKPDREMTGLEKSVFRMLPFTQQMLRGSIYAAMEARAVGFVVSPAIMKVAEMVARAYVRKHVEDPALQEKVIPRYAMGCKRILMSNDYYQALVKDHVEVITDSITAVNATGIETVDGRHREVDVIVFCTGFYAAENILQYEIIGRDGISMAEEWADGAEAYLGTTVKHFPNFFTLVGPNTGLGHNSMIYIIESQVHYIMQALKYVRNHQVKSLCVKPEVQEAYNKEIQARLKKSIWNAGCQSWYLTKDGKNTTLWPGFTFEYRARTRRFDPDDYALVNLDLPAAKTERVTSVA